METMEEEAVEGALLHPAAVDVDLAAEADFLILHENLTAIAEVEAEVDLAIVVVVDSVVVADGLTEEEIEADEECSEAAGVDLAIAVVEEEVDLAIVVDSVVVEVVEVLTISVAVIEGAGDVVVAADSEGLMAATGISRRRNSLTTATTRKMINQRTDLPINPSETVFRMVQRPQNVAFVRILKMVEDVAVALEVEAVGKAAVAAEISLHLVNGG
jgi:hypothetical protein